MRYLAVLIFAVAIASCEKKQCWVCMQTQYNYHTKAIDTFRSNFCDMTEKEIREKEYSDEVLNPDSVVSVTTTTCR